jgi:hypothetical protein
MSRIAATGGSPDNRGSARRRIPRLLSGIGIFGMAATVCELVAQAWPTSAAFLFATLFLFGLVWLAVLVLRICDQVSCASGARLDSLMIYFSGPLSILLLVLSGAFALLNIDQVKGVNQFSSRLSQEIFELLVTTGFVLALCSVVSRRGLHVPPHVCWRIIAAPLVIIFGMYVLLTPISCAASRFGLP